MSPRAGSEGQSLAPRRAKKSPSGLQPTAGTRQAGGEAVRLLGVIQRDCHESRRRYDRRDGDSHPRRRRRACRRAASAARPPPLPLPRPRRSGDLGRPVRPAVRRAEGARGRAPRARRPELPDAPGRCAAFREVPEGRAPLAHGLARESDDRRGAGEVGAGRLQTARRPSRGSLLGDRAEDRRLRDLARLRERRALTGCDEGRRPPGRGRDAEPPHDPVDPAPPPR